MRNKILLGLAIFVFAACSPMSKDMYMKRYADFVEEISAKASSYAADDWDKYDQKYKKYSDVWYKKFQTELTASDKLLLAGYKVKYNYYRNICKTSDSVMDMVNDFMNDINASDSEMPLDNFADKVDKIIEQISDELNK